MTLQDIDWSSYADACLTHDRDEYVVSHAADLAAQAGRDS